MQRLLVALAFFAMPAHAQDGGLPLDLNQDSYELERLDESRAILRYSNAADRMSRGGDQHLTDDGLTVIVRTMVNQGPEHILVTPPDGWIAIPEEADVEDGEEIEILIIRGDLPMG